MKNVLSLIFTFTLFSAFTSLALAEPRDSVDYYINRQKVYDGLKEKRIQQIKKKIASHPASSIDLYGLYEELFNEYRSFIYDSAYVCVSKLHELSKQLNDTGKVISSRTKLGFCYLSSGLFKEAFDVLSSVNIDGCSPDIKIEYYTCKARLYFDLGDYNNSDEFRDQYNRTGIAIIDSALSLLPQNSSRYWASAGLKHMKSGNLENAKEAFHKMIDSSQYTEHELAIATSSIAHIYNLQGYKEQAKNYLIKAAVADIKSSVKETVAIRNLAQLVYEEGEIGSAVRYIRKALADASFYNSRHRQLEIGLILPIIEGDWMEIIENQRDRIFTYSAFISLLLFALTGALVILWRSLKRLNAARITIQNANVKLTEANKIKDEYIAWFFNQNSEFIGKTERMQKWVIRKVAAKQFDTLNSFTQVFNTKKEREALFEQFDKIFLKLFPDFIIEFNKLLKPEEQITVKAKELLNTDLRIYALIRLGINDNEKIAQFLDYSVNTIYAYKTKIKNKAIYPSEQFREKVMEIKSI